MYIMLAAFVVIIFILGYKIVSRGKVMIHLAKKYQLTEATIEKKQIRLSHNNTNAGGWLFVRYSVNSTDYQTRYGISSSSYSSKQLGDPVDIAYDPENPKISCLKQDVDLFIRDQQKRK